MIDSHDAALRAALRCRIGWHDWNKRMWVDSTPFSLSPLAGKRECQRCGKRQRFFYDSQGGCWTGD